MYRYIAQFNNQSNKHMLSLLLALIVGFVAGLLVARNNKAKVDQAVDQVKSKVADIKAKK